MSKLESNAIKEIAYLLVQLLVVSGSEEINSIILALALPMEDLNSIMKTRSTQSVSSRSPQVLSSICRFDGPNCWNG